MTRYDPVYRFTADERRHLTNLEDRVFAANRKAGIKDRAVDLEATAVGPFGQFAAWKILGGEPVPYLDAFPNPGRDLHRVESGRRVCYEIKATNSRAHQWLMFNDRQAVTWFNADRGLLVTPLEDGDFRAAMEVRGWFPRSEWRMYSTPAHWAPDTSRVFPTARLKSIDELPAHDPTIRANRIPDDEPPADEVSGDIEALRERIRKGVA